MRGNGVTVTNLDSDVFWTTVQQTHIVDQLLARPAPSARRRRSSRPCRGYVAGYNRWLHDIGGARGIKDPACHGKAWVHPITKKDAYLRFYQLVLLAGQDVVMPGIAEAQPPSPSNPAPVATIDPQRAARLLAVGLASVDGRPGLQRRRRRQGRDDRPHARRCCSATRTSLGSDTDRFYQAQLTIPGSSMSPAPRCSACRVVLIGHNADVAWSHTVSTAFRFTPYQLTLVPGDPTSYLVDGTPTKMQQRTVTVTVRGQRRQAHDAVAHDLLDPLRPGVQQHPRHPAAVDARRLRSRSATPTSTTSASSTTSSVTTRRRRRPPSSAC